MDSTAYQSPSLEDVRGALRVVCQGSRVQKVEVFGSVAQGGSRADSDLDILVDFVPGAQVGLFETGSLKDDIEERLQCRVDLLTRNAVEASSNPYRRKAILTSLVVVYVR